MPKDFSLSESIKRLEELESYFQKPDMDIDEAIRKHEQALAIAKEVTTYLQTAESTIESIDVQTAIQGEEDPTLEG